MPGDNGDNDGDNGDYNGDNDGNEDNIGDGEGGTVETQHQAKLVSC